MPATIYCKSAKNLIVNYFNLHRDKTSIKIASLDRLSDHIQKTMTNPQRMITIDISSRDIIAAVTNFPGLELYLAGCDAIYQPGVTICAGVGDNDEVRLVVPDSAYHEKILEDLNKSMDEFSTKEYLSLIASFNE